PGSNLQYENTFNLLYGRDSCSDVFGPDVSNQNCSPSLTLCCVRLDQEYPARHRSLGKGWCCIGNNPTDDCYVDQPSVCEEKNSVRCTNLAEGTTAACCPHLTSCVSDTPASKDVVRCNIQYADLQRAAAGSDEPSSSFPSSASIATTSDVSSRMNLSTTVTSSVAPAASTPATSTAAGNTTHMPLPSDTTDSQGQGQGMSELSQAEPGLIAGAAVGGTLGFVALLVLGYLLLRRLLKTRQRGDRPPTPKASQLPAYGYHDYTQTTTVGPPRYGYPELSAEPAGAIPKHYHEPVELPAPR
ncbi:hypothetical protein C7999DRAFT_17562, partial [Corynascus novoguineensis]